VGSLCVGYVGVVMGGEDLAASRVGSLHSVLVSVSGFCLRCALGVVFQGSDPASQIGRGSSVFLGMGGEVLTD